MIEHSSLHDRLDPSRGHMPSSSSGIACGGKELKLEHGRYSEGAGDIQMEPTEGFKDGLSFDTQLRTFNPKKPTMTKIQFFPPSLVRYFTEREEVSRNSLADRSLRPVVIKRHAINSLLRADICQIFRTAYALSFVVHNNIGSSTTLCRAIICSILLLVLEAFY